MRVPVKSLGEGTVFYVEAEPTDTVKNFKDKVREKLRGVLPTDTIQLLYGGDQLHDHQTLSSVGVDGRFFVGVEVTTKQGRSAMVGPALVSKSIGLHPNPATAVPAVSVSLHLPGAQPVQVLEAEPTVDDDIFEIFRYLTSKYHRCTARPSPTDDRMYSSTFSMSHTELNDLDKLREMGFRVSTALPAYIACEKNVNAAANLLLQD